MKQAGPPRGKKKSPAKHPGWAIRLSIALDGAGETDRKVLAKRLHVVPRTISHWLAGSRQPPFDKFVELCEIAGVTTDWVLRRKGASPAAQEYRAASSEK